MRWIRFTVSQRKQLHLIQKGRDITYEMEIHFSLSCLMTILNKVFLYPQKQESVIAKIKFSFDKENSWGHRGIWRDTETIQTMVNDIGFKFLVIATHYQGKWFPVSNTDGETLPDSFAIEVQLESQRDRKPMSKPLRSKIVTEKGKLTEKGFRSHN